MTDEATPFFPLILPDGITARLLSPEDSKWVASAVGPTIFAGIDSEHYRHVPNDRYEAVAALEDRFVRSSPISIGFFESGGEPVGWYYGYMEEAHTHFIDTVGLLAEYRGKGIYSAFLKQLLAYLERLGYERVTVSHQPQNRAAMIPELKAGFLIAGLELHEERGPAIKLVYLVHEDRRHAFDKYFGLLAF